MNPRNPAPVLLPLFFILSTVARLPAQTPTINSGGVVNAASYSSVSGVARGSIVTIFGTNLSTGVAAVDKLPLPTQLAGTQVMFGSAAAPLFFVSPTQINAQVPFELPSTASSSSLVVRSGNLSSASVNVSLTSQDPALFTLLQSGQGPAAILHADGTVVHPWNPVKAGEVLILFCTGLGAVNPTVKSGEAAPSAEPLARVTTLPSVRLDGRTAQMEFAGLAPGYVGLYQVNVRVPSDFTDPAPNVVLSQGSRTARTVSAGAIGLLAASPASVAAGSPDLGVSVAGMFLSANASLNFGGRKLTSRFQQGPPQTLTATVPAGALRVTGSIPIYATSPETGTTESNRVDFSITGSSIPGTAPTISNWSMSDPSPSGSLALYTGSFDFQDLDGDIVYNGTMQNSAKLEFRLPGVCTVTVASSGLSVPDQTSGKIQFRFFISWRAQTTGQFTVTATLIDQAGNRSNSVSWSPGLWIC